MEMNIQWYPGHMTKTRRMIAENLKQVDAVCEILDARIPISSRIPDADELTRGKPRLIDVYKRQRGTVRQRALREETSRPAVTSIVLQAEEGSRSLF